MTARRSVTEGSVPADFGKSCYEAFALPSGRRWRDRRMWLDHDNGSGRHRSCQLIQQRLCLLQDRRVETFTEPVIDRREQVTGFRMSVLVPREPRELRAIGKMFARCPRKSFG